MDAFFNRIISEGYNLVKIDYALNAKYYQPVQLNQVNQAMAYLQENSETLGIDMDNIVIMGGSAGAVLTSQYGLILTNSEYAKRIDIVPSISKEQVKCLVIDDPPIDLDRASWQLKAMVFPQIGTNDSKSEEYKLYQSADFVDENYIPSFVASANGEEFVDDANELVQNLQRANVEVEYYTKTEEEAGELVHCFMEVVYSENAYAKEAAQHMLDFMASHVSK